MRRAIIFWVLVFVAASSLNADTSIAWTSAKTWSGRLLRHAMPLLARIGAQLGS